MKPGVASKELPRIMRPSCRSSMYAVVDATTGKELAAYEADREVAGPMMCYAPDPDRFFTFEQQSGTVLDIVQAEPK